MAAQKTNLMHSGGPRTTKGKLRSKYNARKHGFFSKELHRSADERTEFIELRSSLWEELKPDTALLALMFDDVMACAWRVKVALRCEQRAVKKQLDFGDDTQPPSEKLRMDFPYPATVLELRPRLQLLENVMADFEQSSFLSPALEEQISQAFGAEFWNTLREWNPANAMLMRLMECTLERNRVFGKELPVDPPTADEEYLYMQYDTNSRIQMVLKLMNLKKQDLQLALYRARQANTDGTSKPEAMGRPDLSLRYQTTARREFYRALGEYHEAKARLA